MKAVWKEICSLRNSTRPFLQQNEYRIQRTERDEQEIRKMKFSVGINKRATGSSRLSVSDDVEVECAVYGPVRWKEHEIGKRENVLREKGVLNIEVVFAPFSLDLFHKRSSKDLEKEQEYSQLIKNAVSAAVCLEDYPQCTFSVFIYILKGGWCDSTVSSAINCVSASLLDACISMNDVVTATTFCHTEETVLFDATEEELLHSKNTGLVCWMNMQNKYTQLKIDGESKALLGILEICIDNCSAVFEVIKDVYKQTNIVSQDKTLE